MENLNLEEIKKRAISGTVALTLRTFFLQIVSLLATFILTIYLSPATFGVFFVVSALVNFLVYFSDIGLAAALIQKKENITDTDLKTTFTLQQFLVGGLMLIAFIVSGSIARFYHLGNEEIWLFRALAFSLFLSSLKTIPSILLERELKFSRLIIPQIAETLLFNITAVVLAIKGFGIASFTWAVLIRGISGLIVMYLVSPWRPGLFFDRTSARSLLRFGLPFQLNSILALLKDDLMTLFLGRFLGLTEIGYLGWAQKWANTPLRFLMDNIIKVTFPAYSRLQNETIILCRAIEKSIFVLSLTIFPVLAIAALSATPLIELIPRYQKWQPALIPLYFLLINAALAAITTPLTNALNAIGKIKITLKLMLMWTTLTWLLIPILSRFYGVNGASFALTLVSSSSFIAFYFIKKELPNLSLFKNVKTSLLATALMLIAGYFLSRLLPISWTAIIAVNFSAILIYLGTVLFFEGKTIAADFKRISV